MDAALNKLEANLKCHQQSVTVVRTAVFSVMYAHGPISVNELTKFVNKTSPKINRSSIYRTIHLFESLGIINRIVTGWKYKLELSDEYHSHHHHLICISCGQAVDFHESQTLINELAVIANKYKFSNVRHTLELHGLCQKCQHKK